MRDISEQLSELLRGYLPSVVSAVVIVILGWLAALALAALVRGAVNRFTTRRQQLGGEDGPLDAPDAGRFAGRIAFFVTLTFVLAGAFQALRLQSVAGPLDTMLTRFTGYLPQVFGAAVLFAVALAMAGALRFVVRKGLEKSDLADRLAVRAGFDADQSVGRAVSDVAFWGTLLVFVPAILGVLELEALVQPLQSVFDETVGILPNVAAAALIMLVGWLLAGFLRQLVTGLLESSGADRLGNRFGMGPDDGARRLSVVAGLLTYALVLLPAATAAFEALGIEAISGPAMRLLDQVLAAVPLLFGAGVLLGLAYLAGRVLATLASGVLGGLGFDGLFKHLGLQIGPDSRSPSEIVGTIVLVALMLVASIEAAGLLGLQSLAALAGQFFAFGARVLLSLAILGTGLFLGRLAYRVVPRDTRTGSALLPAVAHGSIVVLAATMALQNTGIADRVVTLAFGLVLGAAALAAAIAFGWGGREAARKVLEGAVANVGSPSEG